MDTLQVTLFGEPRFVLDGKDVRFDAPPRALPLLAYILLHGDAPIDRGVLAAAMWPDVLDEEARANLRRHLHYIKRALPACPTGRAWIEVTPKTVRLDPHAPLVLDVAQFERLAADDARRDEAIALYVDDLFPRCEDEWIAVERDRLRAQQIALLERGFAEAVGTGEHERALGYAARLLVHDPWREDVVRETIALRVARGDRAGAHAEYQRFAARLREELDVDPMPETRAALEGTALPTREQRVTSRLVGREVETATILRAWRAAREGRGQLVLVGGEAGAGKTALSEDAAAHAQGEGATVLVGGAAPDPAAPYELYRGALRGPYAYLMRDVREGIDDEQARTRLFAAVGDAFETTARTAPLVIRLEDVHWSGPAAIALLEYLARRLASSPVLILATYRDEEVSLSHPIRTLRRRLARAPSFTHLALRGLDERAVATLATARLGATRAVALSDAIHQATGGNAFFVVELVGAAGEGSELAAATDVQQLIEARIARVEPVARELAGDAAVIGPTFGIPLLQQLSSRDTASIAAALAELEDRRLIRGASGGEYTFAHELVRRAIYDAVPEERRQTLHARLAALLPSCPGADDRAATIAFHADRGLLSDAASWYIRAARHARALHADEEALEYAERGLDLATEPREHFEALLVIETVHRRRGPRDRRETALRQLELLAIELDDDARREVALRRVDSALAADDLPRADRALAELRTLVRTGAQRGELWYWEAALARRRGDGAAAAELLQRSLAMLPAEWRSAFAARALALDIAVERGTASNEFLAAIIDSQRGVVDAAVRCALLQSACRALLRISPTQARGLADESLALAERAGDRLLEAHAHRLLSSAASYLHDTRAAREHIERASRLTARYGSVSDEVAIAVSRGIVAMMLGRTDEALEINHRALRLAELNGLHEKRVQLFSNSAIAHGWRREIHAAQRNVEQARRLADEHGLGGFEGMLRLNTAWVALFAGDYERTVAELEGYIARFRADQPDSLGTALCDLAVAYTGLQRLEDAKRAADEAWDVFSTVSPSGWARSHNLFALACVQHELGDRDAARTLVTAARDALLADAAAAGDDRAGVLAVPTNREIVLAYDEDCWSWPFGGKLGAGEETVRVSV